MSFDIFLQRFHHGEAADADGQAVIAVLEPLLTNRSDESGRVVTADGGADVYGIDDPESGLMINHTDGEEIWDVIVELARAGGMLVMPVGCPTCGVDPELAPHVPAEAPPFELIRTGADLRRVVETA